jgi:2-dehydro-3-deoxygluconokinase
MTSAATDKSGGLFDVPEARELDLLALGGIVVRFDSGHIPIERAQVTALHISGAEYNVAANLADAFGLRTGVASAMVDYPLGSLAERAVRAAGVRGYYRRFTHDGVTGPNLAAVYSDRGHGVRAPIVFYNRANEAAAMLKAGDFDWPTIFGKGIRWFHTGGLFAGLSATTPALISEAMAAARSHGAVVSYDLNYRAKLWNIRGGLAEARTVTAPIMESVDVLVGNEEDIQLTLGIPGPDISSGRAPLDEYVEMIQKVVRRYPTIRLIASTLRDVRSATRHVWSAVAWSAGEVYTAPSIELEVLDRVGGGDGFASGLIFGLLNGRSIDQALRLGWAHGALVTTYPGDTTMATLDEVESLAMGATQRIRR